MSSLNDKAKAKLPDFTWAETFDDRWKQVEAAEKKTELSHLQKKLTDANYEDLYTQLLKYDDPFGASFSTVGSRLPTVSLARAKTDRDVLKKMERANRELESSQHELQSKRLQHHLSSNERSLPRTPRNIIQKMMRAFKRGDNLHSK